MKHQIEITRIKPYSGRAVRAFVTVVVDGTEYRDCRIIEEQGQPAKVSEPLSAVTDEVSNQRRQLAVRWSPSVRAAISATVLAQWRQRVEATPQTTLF